MNMTFTTPESSVNPPSIQSSIIPYCLVANNKYKCDVVTYKKIKTSVNDPSITKAMRFSQYIRTTTGYKHVSGYT